MTTTVNSVVDKITDQILNDASNARWTDTEVITWINEAQLTIATLTTDAKVSVSTETLSAGVPQTAPTDAIRILDIRSSSNSVNSTVGPMRRVQKQATSIVADIYSATAVDNVKEWMYDSAFPRNYEVYPPASANARVSMVYNPVPSTVSAGGNIDIADHYVPSIIDWVAYRAFSKDTEDVSPDLGKSTAHFRAFALSVGHKDLGDEMGEPRKVDV